MLVWIKKMLSSYESPEDYAIDQVTGDKYSLAGLCAELTRHVHSLEERIKKLEEENVETTNVLYEVINSIEAVDRRIDILADDWGNQFDV
jgi:septal ring factor EnvC (AmiA/AmiB activator)